MASGHLCLNLSESVTWKEFDGFARSLIALIGARRTKVTDGPEMRIWDVTLDDVAVALVWSDYPSMTSLESSSSDADALLPRIFVQLRTVQH